MGGFRPIRTLRGDCNFSTRRFKKNTGGNDSALIYAGDVVKLDAAGTVSRLLVTDVSAAGIAGGVAGVVRNVCTNEAGRAKVHSLTNGVHPNISVSSDTDWLDVWVDPDIIYEADIDTSAAFSLIGQTVGIKVTARNTAAGISGMKLDTTVSASTLNPFKIIGITPRQLDTRLGATNGLVECIVNYSFVKTNATF